MQPVVFTTDLTAEPMLAIPSEIAGQLPTVGRARVIVLPMDEEDIPWRHAAYRQFLRDDSPEDAIYDALR